MAHSAPSSSSSSFNPTDEELIQRFLSKKANRQPLPNDATNNIHECDLYGEKNPWEIWEAFGGGNRRELYFFSIKKRKASGLVRTIGLGSWEAENKGRAILAKGTRQRIGTKKCLRFDKSGTNHDGAWIMHEYSLHKSLISLLYVNNYALCKLIKNEGNHIQQKADKERTGQEVITGPRTRQSTTLQIAANDASTNNNGGLGDIEERPIRSEKGQLQEAGGDERTKVDETTATTTQHDHEEHDERTNEEPLMQEEEEEEEEEERIQLIPNPVARDLLLERFEGLTLGGNVASNLKSSSENTAAAAANSSMSTSTTVFTGRKRECRICHRAFSTRQALAGHMRLHQEAGNNNNNNGNGNNSGGVMTSEGGASAHRHRDFDLNNPVPPAGLEGGE